MKYYISASTLVGEPIDLKSKYGLQDETTGVKRAQALAHKAAAAHPGLYIFVAWFRASDGQKGYLNPGGNHDITGKRY